MILHCKRTYFDINKDVIWSCDKFYEAHEPVNYKKEFGIFLYVECEITTYGLAAITEKDFHKYFETLDHYRNNRINQILEW